jgi:lysophospholipase L1-like esterase
MKKIVFIAMIFLVIVLTGGNIIMANYIIQMGQRNAENTEWDNHYPITKAENVLMDNGKTLDLQLEANAKLLPIDITQYGAVGDGVADCIDAFNDIVQSSEADVTTKVANPNFVDGNSDGVADNWTPYTGTDITGALSIGNGQTVSVTASTAIGGKGVYQDIPVSAGEVFGFATSYKSSVDSGSFSPAISVHAVNNVGSIVSILDSIYLMNSAIDTTYESDFYTIPSGATKLRLYFMAYANAVGDKGTATFKGVSLIKKGVLLKPIKFPQNTTNNAIYYFSSVPSLDNLLIDSDDGVVLSFPSTNGVSFKHVKFLNDINIISRDRSNTGKQYRSDISDLAYNTLTDNDIDIGVKKLSLLADANVQKKLYIANAGATTTATLAYDSTNKMYYMANSGDIAHNTSQIVTTEFDYLVGNSYDCDFEFTVPETSENVCVGVTFSDGTNANWGIVGIRPDGTGIGVGNISSSVILLSVRNYKSLLTDAYKLKYGVIFTIRPITNRKFDIYLNGFYLQTFTTAFDYTKIGFGMICVNQTGQGLQNVKWGRIVTGLCKKHNYGNTLNIVAFGDSIMFGEGSISLVEHIPRFLTGQKGITKVNVTNYSSSGNRSDNQLSVMQSVNLSGFDMVLILIGTNDIQSDIPLTTFKTNIQSMITLAKELDRKVVIGIPPMWISQTLTGVGAVTANYDKGSAYRSTIMQLAATNEIYIADTMSEIGRIGVDNVLNTERDNLHPNGFGQVLIARCFARSILEAVTSDVP